MLRVIVPLLIGAAIGVGATFLLFGGARDGSSAASGSAADSDMLTSAAAVQAAGRYLAAYRGAQSVDNVRTIERRLAVLFAEPYSLARDAEIAALFERLAAIDLHRAIRVAETPGFDVTLAADVVRALAETDADAALEALAAARNPTLQIELAVALLQALGSDAASLTRIAAVLPEHQRILLEVEALGELARTDPDGALRTALGIADDGIRSAAAQRVGVEWAHRDAVAAFESRGQLPVDVRDAYRDAVAAEWARLDSSDFLAYADSQGTLNDMLMGLMHTLGVDPERTFEVASTHPPLTIAGPFAAYVTVERTSFANSAWKDPERYLAVLEAMPRDQRRQQLTAAFAEAYARSRPEDALAWAQAQPQPNLQVRVMSETAVNDHALAYRWANELYERTGNLAGAQNVAVQVGNYAGADPRRAEIATEMLAQKDNPLAQTVVTRMLAQWVQNDPETALDWMLANQSSVGPDMAGTIAVRLAARDAVRAASYIDKLPAELRGVWLERVAAPYARQDPDGAGVWLQRFQGEEIYETVLLRVVQQTAQVDPAAAARLLPAMPAELQARIAVGIANGIARDDLAAAAHWAAGLGDDTARSNAIQQVVTSWATRDPSSAQRWALDLPRGETRDRALSGILNRLARNGFHVTLDERLLEAFDSAETRDQQIARISSAVAVEDPEHARRWLGRIGDPELRERTERLLEAARAANR